MACASTLSELHLAAARWERACPTGSDAMLTVPEAFEKFRGRLKISTSEQQDASRRQQKIREQVRGGLAVETDFLTGSYGRNTKTSPLKDVDIFVVLKESEADYLSLSPDAVLDRLIEILSEHYPGRV